MAWVNCMAGAGSGNTSISVFAYIEQERIPPVAIPGGASVLGLPSRHFTFTAPSGLLIDYFDSAVAPAHTPLRIMITYPGVASTIIDITAFLDESSLSDQPATWPGFTAPPLSSCSSAATFPAGAARYPGAPPLGVITSTRSLATPAAESSDTSAPYASGRRLLEQKRRILPGQIAGSPQTPPVPPPSPSPRPPMPPPTPPCANYSSAVYNCCSTYSPYSCSAVTVSYCSGVASVSLSNSSNYIYTRLASPPPSPAGGRRSLLQTSAPLLFGTLAASFNLNDGSYVVPSSTVSVNLSWSNWPSEAQVLCLSYLSLEQCQSTAANLGGNGDGTANMSPDVGTMTLSYLSNTAASNNTYIGLTGGVATTVVPPLPGFPFPTSQFPVMTTTGYLARIWYFLLGPYKQTLFCWIHVNIALPCVGGSTSCGSVNFDIVNQNSFLVLVSDNAVATGTPAAPPPPNGFFQFTGCRSNIIMPTFIGWYGSMADCLNNGMRLGMALVSGGVCGNMDLTCRSCYGCTYEQVADDTCYLGLDATGCDVRLLCD